jgi:predicted phage terminase large subunit-like protein
MHRRKGEGNSLITFTQTSERNLPLCQKLEGALSRLGFNYGVHDTQPTALSAAGTPHQRRRAYYLKSDAGTGSNKNGPSLRASRLTLNQRFLHLVKPTKWRDRIVDTTANGRMYTTTEKVVSIEPDGIETVYGLTTETGNYVVWGLASSNSGQYQQDPAPRGGGIIRREWWQVWDDDTAKKNGCAPNTYPQFEYIIASLDTAFTQNDENDPSALSIWGIFKDPNGNPKIFLMYCWYDWLRFHELLSRVGLDCQKFKIDRLIIEGKAAGHSVDQELHRLFGSFSYGIELVDPRRGFIKTADKEARLQTVVHLFAEGLVFAPDKEWADDMINQCAIFPRALHDDLVDTCSMALIYLRRTGWALKREEAAQSFADETRYRPRAGALYPV